MPKVLVVCGPTASGKTAFAVALAKQLHTEIISADSMLIYQGLDIGTAKPTKEEMDGVVHHMIDVVSPAESFSVSEYEEMALPILNRLLAEGKTPILCGGTGFYIRALLYRSQFGNAAGNSEIRAKYEEILKDRGGEYLHGLLAQVDPESAAKLHQNDVKRVIRALEIYDLTGRKKSDQKDEDVARFDFVSVAFDYPRAVLYDRIGKRVDQMFRSGLVAEVQSLVAQGITEKHQCMQGIGYKEVLNYLNIEQKTSITFDIIEAMSGIIKKNTRNYAKRQITFFKRMEHFTWLTPDGSALERTLELLQ